MLRIQRLSDRRDVVFALSGRIEAEDVIELQKILQSEVKDGNVALDLKDVRLVNQEAVRFLADFEAGGAKLENCPVYIREWIARERDGGSPRK
jgi:hypothetical protein